MAAKYPMISERDEELYANHKKGMMDSSLARKYGISRTRVKEIIAFMRQHDTDIELWDWFQSVQLVPRR